MSRIKIILGHTGSGKSEYAVNLAIEECKKNKDVTLIDLDVVNPYFCVRDIKNRLKTVYGITVVNSNSDYRNAELMVLPKDGIECLTNKNNNVIIDVGGDTSGAMVLKQYLDFLKCESLEVNVVINTLRMETKSVEDIIKNIKDLEKASGLKVSNIICNTNLLDETDIDHIKDGELLLEKVCDKLNLNIKYTIIHERLKQYKENLTNCAFIIKNYLKNPW